MSQDARSDEELATQRRARILNLSYVDTSKIADKQLYKDLLTEPQIREYRIVPLQADKSNVLFGITTTTSQQTMNAIKAHFNSQRITFAIISENGFRDYLRLYNPPKQITYEDVSLGTTTDLDLIKSVSATLEQVLSDDVLAYLVKQAYRLKASDIHMENEKDDVRIRFRVDGVLHSIARLSPSKYKQLMSSMAIVANMSTASPDPQSGHINQEYAMATGEKVTVNLRVETVPTIYGQDVVMRLFNLKLEMLNLDGLGLSVRERSVVDDIISHPTGMVLVVGPTGSGKTTTLYSLITTLNSDERKIITLEDPVEYYIPGVVQIPVQGDHNTSGFADKLRAVLRLDPDTLMVGEIRDQDTARTALQAALTGHLVLSTFHASSAAAALTRMIDFVGVNPLFASAIRLIMAQRLIRRLDDATKVAFQPDDGLRAQLQTVVDSLPPGVDRPDLSQLTLYKAGTSPANPYGYTGQFPIREQLQMTSGVQQLLRMPPGQVTTDMIEQKAVEEGMITMLQDGVLKVINGDTTLEEVYRVVG
ncbi:MAG TPA: GspE/PulE family protein [Candidatus Saccharimonadales bacterium]|jgi:type II secretory ATPase GspE/PulE/Tfp pilus assembly ATPase PilB-like protein